jgi:hypothetical protein
MGEGAAQRDDEIFDDAAFDSVEPVRGDIVSASTAHDRTQFETDFDFDIDPPRPGVHKRYQIDTWFFLPRNMGVNEENYTRDQFFRGLTNYLRIRTPDTVSVDAVKLEEWALPALDRYLEQHLDFAARQRMSGLVQQEVRMFGCRVNTWFKRVRSMDRSVDGAWSYLDKIRAIVERYRTLYVQRIRHSAVLTDREVRRAVFLVDEYLSYRFEAIVVQSLSALDPLRGSETYRWLLQGWLAAEAIYRKDNGLVYLGGEDRHVARAELLNYRTSLLKKYVSEVLFLKVSSLKREKLYRNAVAALGAGLAATWAAVAETQRMAMMQRQDLGYRLILVIAIGILAYIFKDRLKELSKEWFNERLKKYLPDFDLKMSFPHFAPDGTQRDVALGTSREFMRYLPRSSLPRDVAYLRDRGNRADFDPDRQEAIIHYSKQVTFDGLVGEHPLREVRFIRDVMRLDLSDFLHKLSNPSKTLGYYDLNRGMQTVEAPRVYHLNVLFRFSVDHYDGIRRILRNVQYERVRIILDKQGIVRIETVMPRGMFAWKEEAE